MRIFGLMLFSFNLVVVLSAIFKLDEVDKIIIEAINRSDRDEADNFNW